MEIVKIDTLASVFSPARKEDITFDISIEVFRPGTSKPWIIYLWECKNSSKAIPIDDFEEFVDKLTQVGDHNIKGAIISRNGFQSGAVSIAKTLKIALANHPMEG